MYGFEHLVSKSWCPYDFLKPETLHFKGALPDKKFFESYNISIVILLLSTSFVHLSQIIITLIINLLCSNWKSLKIFTSLKYEKNLPTFSIFLFVLLRFIVSNLLKHIQRFFFAFFAFCADIRGYSSHGPPAHIAPRWAPFMTGGCHLGGPVGVGRALCPSLLMA